MPEKVGRYRILNELGRGSMGTVYRAEDSLIGRVVALKTVRRPGPSSPPQEHEAYGRFLREARAAGTFLHPNLVTVFDVGEDTTEGLSYIAMEMVTGESLDHALRRQQAFDWEQVRQIGWQTASALRAAHDAGIVHRDIKPANLILTSEGDIKVADFGIAKIANAAMTQDGSLLGSPGYMSPEQVRAASVDHRSDLYSLGIVLYELLTLRSAFPGTNVFEVITAVAHTELIRPREIRPEIPADLEAIVVRATAKDREQRFPSAAAMMEALRPAAGASRPRVAHPVPSPPPRSQAVPSDDETAELSPMRPIAADATTQPDSERESTAIIPDAASASAQFRMRLEEERLRAAQAKALAQPPPAPAPAPRGGRGGRWLALSVALVTVLLAAGLLARRGGNAGGGLPAPAPTQATPTIAAMPPSEGAGTEPAPPTHEVQPSSTEVPAPAIDAPTSSPEAPAPEAGAPASTPEAQPSPPAPRPSASRPSPASTARPRPKRSPETSKEPAAAAAVTEPSPTPVVRRWALAVEHRHDFGTCRGTLTVDGRGIRYQSEDKSQDDGDWPWGQVGKIKFGKREINVGARGGIGGVFSGRRFVIKQGKLPPELESYIKEQSGQD